MKLRSQEIRETLWAVAITAALAALCSVCHGADVTLEAEAIAAAVEAECGPARVVACQPDFETADYEAFDNDAYDGELEGDVNWAVEVADPFAPNKGELEQVAWRSETLAWGSDRVIWLHFTDAPYCPPCTVVADMHKDPRVIAASRAFAPVVMCWCDDTLRPRIRAYNIRTFPTDMFLFADDRRRDPLVFEGWRGGPNVGEYLKRFQAAGKAGAIRSNAAR